MTSVAARSGRPTAPARHASYDQANSTKQIPWGLIAAVLGALPTLVWTFAGATLLTDDWPVWYGLHRQGVLDGMWSLAFEAPARPLTGPYYAFTYLVLGEGIVLHGLLLAAINAAAVWVWWRLARELAPRSVAIPFALTFALLPNHASTRLWFVVGTNPLAVALVGVGLRQLLHRRYVRAAVSFAAACMLYEAAVGLVGAACLLWVGLEPRARWRTAVFTVAPAAAACAGMFLLSPKRGADDPLQPFDNADRVVPALLGPGVWGSAVLGLVGGLVVIAFLLRSVVAQLPSWRSHSPAYQWGLVGLGLAAGGTAPFLLTSPLFVTRGIFDRNNLVASVGVALVLAAAWRWASRPLGPAAVVVGAGVLVWFGVLQWHDIDDYRRAATHGEVLLDELASVAAEMPHLPSELLVVPVQPGLDSGVAAFIYNGDVSAALALRTGEKWVGFELVENVGCDALGRRDAPTVVYDWRRGDLERIDPSVAVERCDGWMEPTEELERRS